MAALSRLLKKPERSGVFRYYGSIAEIRREARTAGLTVYVLDMGAVRGKRALLQALAAMFHFPAYFGQNWDALDECLRDLEPSKGRVLIITNGAKFAAKNRQSWGTLVEVLQSAAEYWREQGKAFWVIIVDDAKPVSPELPLLPKD